MDSHGFLNVLYMFTELFDQTEFFETLPSLHIVATTVTKSDLRNPRSTANFAPNTL